MQSSTTESSISSINNSLPADSSTSVAPTDQSDISTLRRDIDRLDESIALALMQRHFLSQKVQVLKRAEGQSSYSPDRENQIIRRLNLLFPMIPLKTLENIYDEIFNWMRPKD